MMTVGCMEKEVHIRTGHDFSTLHDVVYKTELGSQGVEDFIENDSKRLKIVESSKVQAKFDKGPYSSSNCDTELDISHDCFPSLLDYINKCAQATNATSAILRESTFDDKACPESWPFGILDILCWFCPSICFVDVTGCKEFFKSKINNVSAHSRIQIIADFLDPSFLINCKDSGMHIQNILDKNLLSPSTQCDGWSLLHSAILLGDINLVKQLLGTDKNGSSDNSFLQTSLELAIALHHSEIVELFKNELITSMDPLRLVQLCLLPQYGSTFYDHPLEALTANQDVLQAARNSHNSQNCNLNALLQLFCENNDIAFNVKVLEGIFQKAHTSAKSDCLLVLSCWNESAIREAVQMLMKVTQSSPNGKIDGFPYLMFSIPNLPLASYLIHQGAHIDDRDKLGCTALFHAVKEAITSPSDQNRLFINFLLLQDANPNLKNDMGETPLTYSLSSMFRSCELCSKVMDFDENAPTPNKDDMLDVWRLLLDNGAKAKTKDEKDSSPVHLLMNLSHELSAMVCEAVDVLHRNGCSINVRDAEGNTPLHLWAGSPIRGDDSNKESSEKNFEKVANKIISSGGIVNARNDKEETPLHLAQCWKQVEILLESGAQSNVQDFNGDTPFHKFTGKDLVIDDKTKKGRWKKFLTWGMNPWCANNDGVCLFQILLEKGFLQSTFHLLKAIFERGPDEDIVKSTRCFEDLQGNSLLHVFCKINGSNVTSICEYLLEKGWNVNDQNKSGQTPLFLVCSQVESMELPNIENFILLLRKYDADPSIPDSDKNTCQALLHGSKHLQELLQMDIDKAELPCKMKWNQESEKHRLPLFDIAHGKKSQKVERFHHHMNPIGEGSFSLVFPALNESDGREVALKRLEKARLKKHDIQFKREIECLLKLSDCPTVVNYISCISDCNFQYIVVELMEGTLDEYLDTEDQGNKQNAAKVCFDISSGLTFLHENNVLHRDLKPQNILYKTKPTLTAKIADFGLSKILDAAKSHSSSDTVMHSRAGTKCWKAPELLKKTPKKFSKGSDIFSCGLLFHYILTNKQHPFACSESLTTMDTQTTERNIKKNKCSICPFLKPEALHLLTNMLSAEPDKRPVASSLNSFPFFWDERKRKEFLVAVGNQKEFEEPRFSLKRQLTDVEQHLEDVYSKKWANAGWAIEITEIYVDVTSSYQARIYDKKSTVELVRFIRNSYTHVYSLSKTNQELLQEQFVFFQRFPFLVTEVYKAVEASETWKTRRDLSNFF